MARSRNIKPGFFTNDELAECEPLARILFAGIWCFSDRAGRLEDRPKKIKAEILPYDNCDADALLSQLENTGFIIRYQVENSRYIQVVNFDKHQNPHIKEPESTIPAPDLHQIKTVLAEKEPERAGLIPDSLNLIPDPLIPEKKTCSIPDGNEKTSSCPHDEIISLYHEILPELPVVRVWGKDNKANLRARWREDKQRQCLGWWSDMFREIKTYPFLVGAKTDFQATLGWIVGPKNFTKILNGAYRDHRAPPREQPPPRLTGRQAYMAEAARMVQAIEDRNNGIDIEACSRITGAACLSLPGGGA